MFEIQEKILNKNIKLILQLDDKFYLHKKAIENLKDLEEIILFFDGDEAGRKAAEKYQETLKNICKISNVETPEREDVNGLLQGHEPSILNHLIEERKPFIFQLEQSIENKKQ